MVAKGKKRKDLIPFHEKKKSLALKEISDFQKLTRNKVSFVILAK